MQEDELVYYNALEEVCVVGELLSVARLCPGHQLGGMRSSAVGCAPIFVDCRR